MIPYKRGDIVLVAFPFTDLTTTKMKPGLIVSSDQFNRRFCDIIIAAITSQIPRHLSEYEFLLPSHDQKSAGLPKQSIVKIGKIVTLDQRLIRKKLGNITSETLSHLTLALHSILT